MNSKTGREGKQTSVPRSPRPKLDVAPLRIPLGWDLSDELTKLGERFGLEPDELANLLLEPEAFEKLLAIREGLQLALEDRQSTLREDAVSDAADVDERKRKQPHPPAV